MVVEPVKLTPIKLEKFGVQFRSWWPVAWLVFGVFGAAVWAAMVYSKFDPFLTNLWLALGVCHWPVGFFAHVTISNHITFNREVWNVQSVRSKLPEFDTVLWVGMIVGIALVSSAPPRGVFWSGIGLVYVCGVILFAEWEQEHRRRLHE